MMRIEKDQAVMARCRWSNYDIVGIEDLDIEAKSGPSTLSSFENDHTVPARSCGVNSDIFVRDADEIDASRG